MLQYKKMALKNLGTDILAYKIHKDICASNNVSEDFKKA
jgi:hypothetical protein